MHSLLNELMKSDLEFAVKIISKKYKLKPSFVNEKIKLLVQNTFVHLFCELINKKRKDHRLLKEFLLRIGKDAGYIKLLYEIFGDYNKRDDYIGMAKTETESHFYIQLQSELDINKLDDEGEAKFFLIYQKIFASCESIVNDIDKTAEKLILRNGEWDYKQ